MCVSVANAATSLCKDECFNIAAIQGDSPFVLVLPHQQNVVMLGDAGVAVLSPLLFRHGLLNPMLG